MMTLSITSLVFLGIAAVGTLVLLLNLVCFWLLRRRRLPVPERYPAISIVKPLCGLDDELWENLESHVALDYPGEYEVLLGVRSPGDLAYPIAKKFAEAHPDRVRLVLQDGDWGHNPKVNQLIAMTRASRYDIIASTDSNIRVQPNFLTEHASALADPKIGLSSHVFIGVREDRFGSVLDSLTLCSVGATVLALVDVLLRADQTVGKSFAIKKDVLARIGGWHEVKDFLAEDQRLSQALHRVGLRSALCPSPVFNVQCSQGWAQFWARYTRWSMIRFRVILPAQVLEPLLYPFVLSLWAALFSPTSLAAWGLVAAAGLFSMGFTQAAAFIGRGYGFRLRHLVLAPVRDVAMFLAWVRGATLRWVTWRGNRLHVLAKTRLAEPIALARVKSIQRASR